MLHRRSNLSSPLAHTTPFPNALLDEVMPTLRDTEWRLLCLIVRQTLGWQEKGGGRKTHDWLTHRQLQRRTGRASEAVCKALDALVRRGLVEVQDEMGQLLLTPGMRRHHGGKLFFRLGAGAVGRGASSSNTSPQKRKGAEQEKSVFPEANLTKSEKPFSESEIRKAKTTKETETKEKKGVFKKQKEEPAGVAELSADATRFLAEFAAQHRAFIPDAAAIWGRDDLLKLRQLLENHTLHELSALLPVFFGSQSIWIIKQDHSPACFVHAVNVLQVLRPGAKPTGAAP